MADKILICSPLPDKTVEKIPDKFDVTYSEDKVLSSQEIKEKISDKTAIITLLSQKIDEEIIDCAPDLKIISNYAVGYNNIDLEYAKARKILVTNTPDVLTETTADLAFSLILSTARNIPAGDRMVREGRFKGWGACLLLGQDVHGKALGIVGCGRIGKAVARRASGFNMKVIYYDKTRLIPDVEGELNITYREFDELLAESDFVVITAPLTNETQHMFTMAQFKKMKPCSILINTGRGPIVKEDDLVKALNDGTIWGAGLDVYEYEPDIAQGLEKCGYATLLPHLGSASFETRIAMAEMAIQAVVDTLEGRKPKHVV